MAEERYVLIAQMDVAPQAEGEFNDWLNKDHIPAVMKVPGVVSVRRYAAPVGEPKYMTVYELTSPDVPSSPAWNATRSVGRTQKMRPFIRNSTFRIYRQL